MSKLYHRYCSICEIAAGKNTTTSRISMEDIYTEYFCCKYYFKFFKAFFTIIVCLCLIF